MRSAIAFCALGLLIVGGCAKPVPPQSEASKLPAEKSTAVAAPPVAVGSASGGQQQLPSIPTDMTIAKADKALDVLTLKQWDDVHPDKQMALLWHLAKQMHGTEKEEFWQYRARIYFYCLNGESGKSSLPQNLPIRQLIKASDDFNNRIKTWRTPEDFN